MWEIRKGLPGPTVRFANPRVAASLSFWRRLVAAFVNCDGRNQTMNAKIHDKRLNSHNADYHEGRSIFQIEMGRRLSKARRDAGKTQEEAGKAVDKSAATIGRWERGSGSPTIGELYTMSRLYRCQLSELSFGARPELLDISNLWPDTQNIIRRHIEYLLASQRLVEENWLESLRKVGAGSGNIAPPWEI